MEKNWIKIFTSTDYYRCEIMKQVLCENDIDAVLMNKQASSHGFGHIEIYIHQDNFSRAIEVMVLNQF